MPLEDSTNNSLRITEMETRIAFLEDTIETLNQELSELSREFRISKEALQLVYRKLEQVQSDGSGISNPADEPPPPHY